MSQPMLSERWYRLRHLTPQLRPGLRGQLRLGDAQFGFEPLRERRTEQEE